MKLRRNMHVHGGGQPCGGSIPSNAPTSHHAAERWVSLFALFLATLPLGLGSAWSLTAVLPSIPQNAFSTPASPLGAVCICFSATHCFHSVGAHKILCTTYTYPMGGSSLRCKCGVPNNMGTLGGKQRRFLDSQTLLNNS